MSTKRKFEEVSPSEEAAIAFKHTLDSDEDDDEVVEESYNVMKEDEFEGLEEGPAAAETNIGFTAFNMKEELEEGYFDKDGHYLPNKTKEIRDNWLDNINWVEIHPAGSKTVQENENMELSDSDNDEDPNKSFDPISLYKKIIDYLQPGENIRKALCRLGKGKKHLSTAERWKRKKDPVLAAEDDETSKKIAELTELANELLTRTGNMDIYEETYEKIKEMIKPSKKEALDMYADDFETKEKEKLGGDTSKEEQTLGNKSEKEDDGSVTWQLKWSQNEDAEVSGPHKTEKMLSWSREGYFKKGAWVRRTGQEGQFYSAARIDFDLYL